MANLLTLSRQHNKFLEHSLMNKIIKLLMVAGRKNVAYKIFCTAGYQFLRLIESSASFTPLAKLTNKSGTNRQVKGLQKRFSKRITKNPLIPNTRFLLQLQTAVKNIQPSLEGRKCRIAGTTKIVPAVVSTKRGCTLAVRWIIEAAKKRRVGSKLSFSQCLSQEFFDAYKKQGQPRQRRDQNHKVCEGNRGYLRYRWW